MTLPNAPAHLYSRDVLVRTLVIHRQASRGLPITARCFCGWRAAGEETFFDHIADRYEQAAATAIQKALRPLSLSAPA